VNVDLQQDLEVEEVVRELQVQRQQYQQELELVEQV
jgi:hypothetical protein